ncbi:MAG: IS1634 family transposase, partial [Anaerolineae bacterium]
MAEIQSFRHERIDDVPLIIGMCKKLGWSEILNRHLGTHGLQRGLNNGQLTVGWLGYILSQADHRKSAVEEWANDNEHTLGQLLEQPIREVEFNDDRLGGVLRRLSDDEAWDAVERDLWRAAVAVYEMESTDVRMDSTTSYGYHEPEEDGLMQYGGHSKDHRPDLPQLKLMAAAAEPSGHLIASDVVPGQRADDPLYVPLIERVRGILNRAGLLYAGDSKMAALATRAHLAFHGDYYVVPLPMTGETAQVFDSWVEAVVDGDQTATLIWDGDRLIGGGYEFERSRTATVGDESVTWTERVQVVRSQAWVKRQI